MTHMLVMAAREFRSPVTDVVLVECNDLLVHLPRAGTGFHHRKMVSAIAQQMSDATTSGTSCLNS